MPFAWIAQSTEDLKLFLGMDEASNVIWCSRKEALKFHHPVTLWELIDNLGVHPSKIIAEEIKIAKDEELFF